NLFCERVADGGTLELLQRNARRLDAREEAPLPVPGAPTYFLRNLLFSFPGSFVEGAGERLDDLKVGLHARRRRDDGRGSAQPVVAVSAEEVVVLDERGRGQDDRRAPGGVRQEGIHDHDELTRLEGTGDGPGGRQP